MSCQMWFGNEQHAQWVPSPATGMVRNLQGFTDEIEFENGGFWSESSAGQHASYDMQFPVSDASEYEGIEAFNRYRSGEYGSGFLRFVDPMWVDTNLFSPNYASPTLVEQGWKNWGGTTPTFAVTTANAYNKPSRKATWDVSSDANVFQGKPFTFLIPPGYTLSLGVCGSVTGTGVVGVLPVGGSLTAISPSADTAAPSFTSTVAGSTYSSAQVGLARTTTAASTVTVTAMWAQILPTGTTPGITRHLPGRGTTGLRFQGNALPETYVMSEQHLVGLSASLIEVEAWQ